jgi:hypothetical protein
MMQCIWIHRFRTHMTDLSDPSITITSLSNCHKQTRNTTIRTDRSSTIRAEELELTGGPSHAAVRGGGEGGSTSSGG